MAVARHLIEREPMSPRRPLPKRAAHRELPIRGHGRCARLPSYPLPPAAVRSPIGRREELAYLSLDRSMRDAAVLEQLLARPGPRNACHGQAMHRGQTSDRRAHRITETAAQRVIL